MSALRHATYSAASLVARLLVAIFFRRLEVVRDPPLPRGPVLLAANHPNSILDPVLVMAAFPERRIAFVAASFFFDIPLVRWVFRALGVVPVFRREDDPERRGENRSSFDAVVDCLHAGGAVGIFPEGNTFADPRLQTFRTGAARMALEAADRGPEDLDLHLVPVGLNYRNRNAFRSDVLVLVGQPLDPHDHLELWRQDPRAAGRALTERLRAGAEAVTRNLARLEDEALMDRLERVFRSEVAPVGPALQDRFHQARRLLEAVEHFREVDPEGSERLRGLLEEYSDCLEVLDLSGSHLRHPDTGYRPSRILLYLARAFPPILLLALPAAWGLLHNLLPYLLTDPLARRRPDEPQREAVRKIGWGALLFGTFYLGQTLVVAHLAGVSWAGPYLVTLPLTGFLGLWWLDRLRSLRRHLRTFTTFVLRRGFREHLVQLRGQLVEELVDRARRFREARGENPDPREDPLPPS